MESKRADDDLCQPRGWHSRGYLPHFDGGATPQCITFRLADSLPATLLNYWREELKGLSPRARDIEWQSRIESYLDRGAGKCWLKNGELAAIVEAALLCFDKQRYRLHAWVVMPNHVHVLFTLTPPASLSSVVGSWKSFTARNINAVLARSGAFWQEDYFDRYIRNERHFEATIEYIENNPVKAGLCGSPQDWIHSSARCNSRVCK